MSDIDFATTATPDAVTRRAEAAGIKVVPTGLEHGTVTLVIRGSPYEVTTLREDVATDGRRAVVRFGRDWQADAERRDFTVNALSVDRQGFVHDPVGGYADLLACRVRFIGDPDLRIAEDRLRGLRLFRFHAEFGRGGLEPAALSAALRARDGLRELSAERIGQEMRRLVVAPRSVETVALMQESGILPIVLGGIGYLGPVARLAAFEASVGSAPSFARRLAALGARVAEDVQRLSERLRLTNVERDRMLVGLAAVPAFSSLPDARSARRLIYRLGPQTFGDALALAVAWGGAEPTDSAWHDLYRFPDGWQAPTFPLGGRDVISQGRPHGPAVGALLRAVEAWWIERDFVPDAAELRAQLQQMIAAEQ